jgi:hypothetical protein
MEAARDAAVEGETSQRAIRRMRSATALRNATACGRRRKQRQRSRTVTAAAGHVGGASYARAHASCIEADTPHPIVVAYVGRRTRCGRSRTTAVYMLALRVVLGVALRRAAAQCRACASGFCRGLSDCPDGRWRRRDWGAGHGAGVRIVICGARRAWAAGWDRQKKIGVHGAATEAASTGRSASVNCFACG